MRKKAFKAESKRLLDLMINSIYTHKEIFLREIISNASDAADKLCYLSLTDENVGMDRGDFEINITADPANRVLTVSDNGIGMTEQELEANLGTIAKSGSKQFKEDAADDENADLGIIGQFGVGFYSAFMVADKVKVITRAYGSDSAYCWESDGVDGYTITACEKDSVGTDVIMSIKEDTDDENYSRFLDSIEIAALIKRYSDYIRFPIKMEMEDRDDDGNPVFEVETLNSMVPIWQQPKAKVTDEQYTDFYNEKFFNADKPLRTIRVSAEGAVTYTALLFVPSRTPFDYFTKDYEKGLQLYSNGVLIMDRCPDLLGDHFRFIRGVVDSADFSLNLSREVLQHDRQLKTIAANLEKKIKAELKKMLETDRENYETFWKAFGTQIKYGVVEAYGRNKALLGDLLMFWSSTEEKFVTLSEYVSRMKEGQQYIYFASGATHERIEKLPRTERLRDMGYEMLYFTEGVDEFVAEILRDFDGKQFKNVDSDDLGIETEQEKEELQRETDENRELLDFVKETLDGKVKDVRVSSQLKSAPVCLRAEGGFSLEMEKYFNVIQPELGMKADRVLELNPDHPAFVALKGSWATDRDRAKKYAEILYCQALLMADIPLEDPNAYAELVCSLM